MNTWFGIPLPAQLPLSYADIAFSRGRASEWSQHPDPVIRAIAERLAGTLPDQDRLDLENELRIRNHFWQRHQRPEILANTTPEELRELRGTRWEAEACILTDGERLIPATVPINSADYISPAVEHASRVQAASAKLLGEDDKAADPVVFGPEYSYKDDPKRKQY